MICASTYGCSEYRTYGLNFFIESKPIFFAIVTNFFSGVDFLNFINISISAFSGSHVPLAYDPPNSTCKTSGYFETCFSTELKAILATLDFSFSSFLVGITFLFALFRTCFI